MIVWMGEQIETSNYTGLMRYKESPSYFEYFENGVMVFNLWVKDKDSVEWVLKTYPQYKEMVMAFILAAKDGE